MNESLRPLRTAVQQGHQFLLPVCLVALAAGAALIVVETSEIWRFFGMLTALAGLVFLVLWARGRDPHQHPLIRAVRDDPGSVRWVHRQIQPSPLGNADRAVLHVGLDTGEHFALPIDDPALARACEEAILAACPDATHLPEGAAPAT